MKTKIFSLLMVAIAMMVSVSAFAQSVDVANPAPGQTVTYNVTEVSGMTYVWHVYDDGTTTEASTAYTGTLGNTNAITITWTPAAAGSQYDIWVQGTDASGCLTQPMIFDVVLSSPEICIATASTNITDVTTAAPTGTTDGLCSLIASSPVTTGAAATGTTLGDETTFYATLTGAAINASYTVTYEISSSLGTTDEVTTTETLNTNASGNGALAITVSGTDHPTHFYATSDNTVTIKVTKVTYNSVDITNVCSANSYDITVNALPVIAF